MAFLVNNSLLYITGIFFSQIKHAVGPLDLAALFFVYMISFFWLSAKFDFFYEVIPSVGLTTQLLIDL